METKKRYEIKVLESLIPEQAETADLCYFEDLDAHLQEIIIDLFASIIENKQQEE
jgi:hypothetical protein